MTKEIKPTYVTFEQAEKLKEKRFDVKVNTFFDLLSGNQIDNAPLGNYNLTKQSISIPEQWQVVEWLRVNHGIWVCCEVDFDGTFWCRIKSNNIPDARIGKWQVITACAPYNSPQEAYSTAFDYILNNLI